jgi:ribosome-associated heat shock protein Hsp15
MPETMERTRIDRWLWAARFCKTRSLATAAVAGGRVRVNGERVKPAKEVTAGDEVEVRVGETVWTVVIRGVAEKRGSASVAATLYAETEESVTERERRAAERRAQLAHGTGPGGRRPTKLDRRRVDALRRRGG